MRQAVFVAVAVALLALGSVGATDLSSVFTTDILAIDHHIQSMVAELNLQDAAVQGRLPVSNSTFEDFEDDEDDKDKCSKCVCEAAEAITKHAVKHVIETCKKTKCPVLKRHCKWMKEHKKIALGLIIYHTRPHSLGFAYCIGDKSCDHKSTLTDDAYLQEQYGADVVSHALRTNLTQAHKYRLLQITPADAMSPKAASRMFQEIRSTNSTSDDDDEDECRDCVYKVAGHVMHHVLHRFREACEKAEDPYFKKVCHWAKEHAEVFIGMTIGHVRPAEWGSGFCVGHGVCGDE